MRLAFAVDDTDGASRDLWISEPDGANAERVFDCQGPCHDADFPAWSRDGMTIAFASWDEVDGKATESRLELLDVATGQVRTIAQAEGLTTIQNPRWSPNGNAIVLELAHWTDLTSSADIDGVKIGVVDVGAATSAVRMITDPALLATYPDWHPTKDLIVFSTRPWDQLEGPSNLFTIRSDGTGQTQITDFKAGETRAVQPTWTPDGSLIIFTAVEGSGFGNPTMATIKPDGTALTSATSSGPMFGTHPRLRPMP